MLTGNIGSIAGTVVGELWAECSALDTDGWRDVLPNSLL